MNFLNLPSLFARLLLALAATVSAPLVLTAPAGEATTALEYYPWAESAPSARVPKDLLSRIRIPFGVTITNIDMTQLVLTDQLILILQMSREEVRQTTRFLAESLHEYRLEQGRHLERVDAPPALNLPGNIGGRGRPSGIEEIHFQLKPFPGEALAIRQRLDSKIATLLGDERAALFRQFSAVIDSEMRGRENPAPRGAIVAITTTTHTFMLQPVGTGFQVYRMVSETRQPGAGGGGGGSSSGRPYGPSLDQYAPEAMKPILEQWRKRIAEAPPSPPPGVAAGASTSMQEGNSEWEVGTWENGAPYLHLPKTMLGTLRIPGLGLDGGISTEAVSVLGLTPDERTSARSLYTAMRERFEKIEQAHFDRVGLSGSSFVIRPFPEESAALQREWLQKLGELIGGTRAVVLDQYVRIPVSLATLAAGGRLGGAGGMSPASIAQRGPEWLTRGTNEVRIDVTTQNRPDGTPSHSIQYQELPRGGRGTMGSPVGQVPERWRHLLTPEMMKPIEPPVGL